MKKLILLFCLLMSLSFLSYAQPTQIQRFTTIVAMKAYYGNYQAAYVAETNEMYHICSSCVADELTIFAGSGGRKWKLGGSGLWYIANGEGVGDSLLTNDMDTLIVKLIEIEAGSGITVTPNHTAGGLKYTITATGSSTLSAKQIPNANYTINLALDDFIRLPEPTTQRTITLPAASTAQGKIIRIYNAADEVTDWILDGTYIQKGSTIDTEDFTNSGIGSGTSTTLISVEISTGVWKWQEI